MKGNIGTNILPLWSYWEMLDINITRSPALASQDFPQDTIPFTGMDVLT
jgi:hypothetical protein